MLSEKNDCASMWESYLSILETDRPGRLGRIAAPTGNRDIRKRPPGKSGEPKGRRPLALEPAQHPLPGPF